MVEIVEKLTRSRIKLNLKEKFPTRITFPSFHNSLPDHLVISQSDVSFAVKNNYCSLFISQGAEKENLRDNQEFLWLLIIFSILITFMFDSGVML